MIRRHHHVGCAAEGCSVEVGRGQLFCEPHYFSLPRALRDDLWSAWRANMRTRSATLSFAERAALDQAYQAAYEACAEYLRDHLPEITTATAADGSALRYEGGRLL